MNLKKIVVGFLDENCYILTKDNDAVVIDPGDEFEKIDKELKGFNLRAILLTHAHFDHIGALDELIDKYKTDLYYYNVNNEIEYEKIINIEEKEYKINDFTFEVIYTPGHRNDHNCFYFKNENIMFTGDFLFKNTIGRTDLEYGNYKDMLLSLKKIKEYDDDIKIYPGHGEDSILGIEKMNNDYLI